MEAKWIVSAFIDDDGQAVIRLEDYSRPTGKCEPPRIIKMPAEMVDMTIMALQLIHLPPGV